MKSVDQGVLAWVSQQKDWRVWPVTILFHAGPGLYGPEGAEALRREIEIFVEAAYRLFARKKRTREAGWTYCGWPDRGGETDFLHHHGFLLVPMSVDLSQGDLQAILDRAGGRGVGVKRAHVSPRPAGAGDVEGFGGYAQRNEAGDCVWFKAGGAMSDIQWTEKTLGSGLIAWEGAGFTIVGGRADTPFNVFLKPGEVSFSGSRLDAAKTWCESTLREQKWNQRRQA